MAIIEKTILASVEIIYSAVGGRSAAQVLWKDLVLKDGEIISTVHQRKAYNYSQREEFIGEVADAADYLVALGWND